MSSDDNERWTKLLNIKEGENDTPPGEPDRRPAADSSGYYACLGVSPKCSPQEIRRAFLLLSQRYHTDKHVDQSEEIQYVMRERFHELQDAYSVLSDPRQRAAYDAAGADGSRCLALVPSSVNRPENIIQYVTSLNREAEVVRTAKLLSATSSISLSFSTVHLFLELGRRRAAWGVKNLKESPTPTAFTKTAEPNASSSPSPSREVDTTEEVENCVTKEEKALSVTKEDLTIKQVMIDGQPRLVLIPSKKVEQELLEKIVARQGNSTAASDTVGRQSHRRSSLISSLLSSAVPRSLRFQHAFMHVISPTLQMVFRTSAITEGNLTKCYMTTLLEYQPDSISTYTSSWRASIQGLKWNVIHDRALTPIWSLRSKLTVLSQNSIFRKLELTLSRQLSAITKLENTIAMSIVDRGFWRTVISTVSAQDGMEMDFYTTEGDATLGLRSWKTVVYGIETEDKRCSPAYGRIQYSVQLSPFTGRTTAGFEAWYYASAIQKFGVGVSAVLPYTLNPFVPPLFLVASGQLASVNQVSFLYSRGSHTLRIPIVVFVSSNISNALAWLSLPLMVYRVGRILYRPYAKVRAARFYMAERKAHIAETDISREKARLEQLGIENLVLASRTVEDRKGGLVILNARYGVLDPQFIESTPPVSPTTSGTARATTRTPPPLLRRKRRSGWWPSQILAATADAFVRRFLLPKASSSLSESKKADAVGSDAIPLSIDVTIAMQNLVRDSAVVLPSGSKSSLAGFCDPDPYTPERKQLKVVYWFRKRKHMAIFDDEESVELPQREHLMAA